MGTKGCCYPLTGGGARSPSGATAAEGENLDTHKNLRATANAASECKGVDMRLQATRQLRAQG